MLPSTTKVMSPDDHMIEPAGLWAGRVPPSFRDRCPAIVEIDGREMWEYEADIAETNLRKVFAGARGPVG